MKLLLDTHHSRRAAAILRDEGSDVIAASEDPALAEMLDEELLAFASSQGRVMVTEDAKDFGRIVGAWAGADEHHSGVIFTSPRRYHRGSAAYPNNLVAALRKVLENPPDDSTDWVYWLP